MIARVLENRMVAKGYYRMEIKADGLGRGASPGMFYMFRVSGGGTDPLLRRPLSLHMRESDDLVRFLYRDVGKGTGLLSRLEPGGEVDLIGPLGNGFNLGRGLKRALLVAGGIGVAPLVALGGRLMETRPDVTLAAFIGGRSSGDLLAMDEFKRLGIRTYLCTDDGSMARCGMVTDTLSGYLERYKDMAGPGWTAFSCGPRPMMKAVADICGGYKIMNQVSLESHMACGIGACMGCVTDIDTGDGPVYKLVCKDGPVFDANDVVW